MQVLWNWGDGEFAFNAAYTGLAENEDHEILEPWHVGVQQITRNPSD